MIESNRAESCGADCDAMFRFGALTACCAKPNSPVVLLRTVMIAAVLFGCSDVLGNEDFVDVSNPFDNRIPSTDAWRTPNRASVNALYMFLSLCDVDCSYEEALMRLSKSERDPSLLGIRDASSTFGLRSSVYRCTPKALYSLQVPVIAHLEGSRTDGEFCLVLPVRSTSEVFILDVQTCELKAISRDLFLREWGGYILRPETKNLRRYWALVGGAFLLYGSLRLYGQRVLRRVKARRSVVQPKPRD